MQDFAEIWRGAEKIVYSRTLESVSSAGTRIERDLDPEAIRTMKTASERDITVGGAHLAAQAIKAGVVDEYHVLVTPVVAGGGTRALPSGARVTLELLDETRFSGGAVHLHYRPYAPYRAQSMRAGRRIGPWLMCARFPQCPWTAA